MSHFCLTLQHMDELSHNILCLLAENDCVILPSIGGFVASYKPAVYSERHKEFVSPERNVGFNDALTMNDGLIVQSYMISHSLNYPDASRLAERDISRLRDKLNEQGYAVLEGLGRIVKLAAGSYGFEASGSGVLTPSLYGLPSVSIEQRASTPQIENAGEVIHVHTQPIKQQVANEDSAAKSYNITVKRSFVHGIVAVAAAIILSFIISAPIGDSAAPSAQQSASMIGSFAPAASRKAAAPAKAAATTPRPAQNTAEKKAATPETKPVEKPYTIVLASDVSQKNAEYFVKTLHAKGFASAEVLTTSTMRRVVYGKYESEAAARVDLRSLRGNDFAEQAWIYKVPNR